MTNINYSHTSILPNYKWIKFGMEYLNEPEFMQLSGNAAGTYLKLYLLAGKADAGGLLCNPNKVFTIDDLAWFLRCTPVEISTHLDELTRASLMMVDGEGFRITRFLQEQGPGDNEERAKWRARQDKARAKARGEPEQEENKKEDVEQEVEVDSHGDVTVTHEPHSQPPPSVFPSAADIEKFQSLWKSWNNRKLNSEKAKEFFDVISGESSILDWRKRVEECLCVWHKICTKPNSAGWSKSNPDAVMELYPIPNLEERMEREKFTWNDETKEQERKKLLEEYGIL